MNITLEKKAYKPNQRLSGSVSAEEIADAKTAEVRLLWYTQGKGTEDVEVVATKELSVGSVSQNFSFQLPNFPWSFSGTLITLCWAIELVVDDDEIIREDFVMAPNQAEIVLPTDSN